MMRCLLLPLLLGLLYAPVAVAHKPSDSYLHLAATPGQTDVDGRWDIALRDLEYAIGLDADGDGRLTWGEVRRRRDAIVSYAFSRLTLSNAGQPCPTDVGKLQIDRHVDGHYAVLAFTAHCAAPVSALGVDYDLFFNLDPSHKGLLKVVSPAGTQAAVLSAGEHRIDVSLATPDRVAQFGGFVDEGIWHIWTGYDHILFLLTLLFPAVLVWYRRRWIASESLNASVRDILKVVTAFTVAHSLTLSLAVLGIVDLPSRLVESGIALTVLLGAVNNLRPLVHGKRWLVAFSFGLIHGLGFASVLTDLGLHGMSLAVGLVGFNLGVEIGQAAIVLVFVPAAFGLRGTVFYRRAVMPIGSLLIAGIATYWFVIRAFGNTLT